MSDGIENNIILSFSAARKGSEVQYTSQLRGRGLLQLETPPGQHRDMVLVNPSSCLHLPRGGLRGAVLSFSTSPSLYLCLLDLHFFFFLLFETVDCSITGSFQWHLCTSLLSWHSWRNVSQSAKQIKCFLKILLNQKFCRLLPPKVRHALSFLDQVLQQPPQLFYYWPHLFQLHVPDLSSNSEFDLVFLHYFGSDLTEQWPTEDIFHPEWGLKRKPWRSGHYSSGDFKQCHLPSPRNVHSSQSLCKVFYSHIYLHNS